MDIEEKEWNRRKWSNRVRSTFCSSLCDLTDLLDDLHMIGIDPNIISQVNGLKDQLEVIFNQLDATHKKKGE